MEVAPEVERASDGVVAGETTTGRGGSTTSTMLAKKKKVVEVVGTREFIAVEQDAVMYVQQTNQNTVQDDQFVKEGRCNVQVGCGLILSMRGWAVRWGMGLGR